MPEPPFPASEGPTFHRIPPQNIEAEESILSAILIDNSFIVDILDLLGAEDFYKTAHKSIFGAIETLYAKSEPIDLVTLSNALRESGELEKIGGAAYLARLVDTVPLAVNAHHYARIIKDKSILRRLIERTNTISNKCFEDRGEVDRVIELAQSAIFEIAEGKSNKAFTPLSKIIDVNIDALEERQGNRALVTGVTTGFTKLDRLTSGWQNTDLIILAARPAMGKTALALNMARNAAVDAQVPVAIFSLEMSKEQLSMRMLCAEARVDSSRIRSGFLNQEDWNRITDAADRLTNARFVYRRLAGHLHHHHSDQIHAPEDEQGPRLDHHRLPPAHAGETPKSNGVTWKSRKFRVP